MEPVVGLGLLACPSCSSRQPCRLRNLHPFALNSCDNTGSWEDFQPFVQRTSTVCPVHSQKNDFETWCPFWCPSPSQIAPALSDAMSFLPTTRAKRVSTPTVLQAERTPCVLERKAAHVNRQGEI